VLHGIDIYRKIGIPLAKLDVALPWYGYDIVCNDPQPGPTCVTPVGFPNRQIGLGQILDLHNAVGAPPIVFDPITVSKRFDYLEEVNSSRHTQRRRVTYDDVDTLQAKYAAVLRAGVGGVGLWTADATHRDTELDTAALAKEMWASVRNAAAAEVTPTQKLSSSLAARAPAPAMVPPVATTRTLAPASPPTSRRSVASDPSDPPSLDEVGIADLNLTREAYTEIGGMLVSGPAYASSTIWRYMEDGYPCYRAWCSSRASSPNPPSPL
jgi:hypothetical protein